MPRRSEGPLGRFFADPHAVAASLLGLVHGRIGPVEQYIIGFAFPVEDDDPSGSGAVVFHGLCGASLLGG